jgi:carbon storage regulator
MENMLVLTRKPHQEIEIEGNIRLTVLEIRGDRVKLGLIAPRDVEIRRSEIADRGGKFTPEIVHP